LKSINIKNMIIAGCVIFLVAFFTVTSLIIITSGDFASRLVFNVYSEDNELIQQISPHYSETDDIYYVFLPSFSTKNAVTLGFSANRSIKIGDTVLYKNDNIEPLEFGEKYTLVPYGKSKADTKNIKFLRSKNVNTVILSSEYANMDFLKRDRNNEGSGEFRFISETGKNIVPRQTATLRGRGNSSWNMTDKKSFRLRFDTPVALMGNIPTIDYVLYSNSFDTTQLKTLMTLDLADAMNIEFVPRRQLVDFYLNSEYIGAYLLAQQIDAGENEFIDIADLNRENVNANTNVFTGPTALRRLSRQTTEELPDGRKIRFHSFNSNPEDITGGYLLETSSEYKARNADYFISARKQFLAITSPKTVSRKQILYISDLFQRFEDALSNHDFELVSDYIDIDSAARSFILQEFTKNIDAGRSSFYFYKDSDQRGDGRIRFCSPWDFDLAYGNKNFFPVFFDSQSPFTLFNKRTFRREDDESFLLLQALYDIPEFRELVMDLWDSEVSYTAGNLSVTDYIERYFATVQMNFIRYQEMYIEMEIGNFSDELDFLNHFVRTRTGFFDDLWTDRLPLHTVHIAHFFPRFEYINSEVLHGEKFTELPDFTDNPDFLGWAYWRNKDETVDDAERFSPDMPITEDITIRPVFMDADKTAAGFDLRSFINSNHTLIRLSLAAFVSFPMILLMSFLMLKKPRRNKYD